MRGCRSSADADVKRQMAHGQLLRILHATRKQQLEDNSLLQPSALLVWLTCAMMEKFRMRSGLKCATE